MGMSTIYAGSKVLFIIPWANRKGFWWEYLLSFYILNLFSFYNKSLLIWRFLCYNKIIYRTRLGFSENPPEINHRISYISESHESAL
jgi:hypothetical protein